VLSGLTLTAHATGLRPASARYKDWNNGALNPHSLQLAGCIQNPNWFTSKVRFLVGLHNALGVALTPLADHYGIRFDAIANVVILGNHR
jgi:hypothetical protein